MARPKCYSLLKVNVPELKLGAKVSWRASSMAPARRLGCICGISNSHLNTGTKKRHSQSLTRCPASATLAREAYLPFAATKSTSSCISSGLYTVSPGDHKTWWGNDVQIVIYSTIDEVYRDLGTQVV